MTGPEPELDIVLRAGALDAGIMRAALRRFCDLRCVDEQRAAACEIAVGEALCNAVEHAYREGYGTMRLRAGITDATLFVEVSDNGRWRPEPASDAGRGFLIMGAFARSVDIVRGRSGTTVRMTFPTH